MDPLQDRDRASYPLPQGQRQDLIDNPFLGDKETSRSEKIKKRAGCLDDRFQHLVEDIKLLHQSRVLDSVGRADLKQRLEGINPPIEGRADVVSLQREIKNPEWMKVSSFGLALGDMLSLIYSGDEVEQTRLWWGLALGYFGHPTREFPQSYVNLSDFSILSRSFKEPQQILSGVSRTFDELENSNRAYLADADLMARDVLEQFEQILREFLSKNITVNDATDLPFEIQGFVIASLQGGLSQEHLCDVFYNHLVITGESAKDDPPSLVEENYSVATGTAAEILLDRSVDMTVLRELNDLWNSLQNDLDWIAEKEIAGIVVSDVIHILRQSETPQKPQAVNNEIHKGNNNVTRVLRRLTGENKGREHKWDFRPPVENVPGGFRLNSYGELLACLSFESERPLADLYLQAFSEDIRSEFDIHEEVSMHVDALVESDVPV